MPSFARKLDYNLAQVNVSEAEAALLEAGNHRLAGYAALNQAMGLEGGESYDMAPVALDMFERHDVDSFSRRDRERSGHCSVVRG